MNIKNRVFTFLTLFISLGSTAYAFDWAPVNQDELKMTAEPKAPGAAAIILEVRQDHDHEVNKVSGYYRLKILSEEGRKFANVEIRYEKKQDDSVEDIEARVIHPDGTVTNFTGTIYDKLIVKSGDEEYQAKVFALPDVAVGSIIEYHYTLQFFPRYEVAASRWDLSGNLFIKHGYYSLRPNRIWQLQYGWPRGLPPGTPDPVRKDARIIVDTHDVPALIEEDHMPPTLELSYHVDFFYNLLHIKEQSNPEKFWQEFDETMYRGSNNFIGSSSAMEKTVAQLTDKNDTPEQKLRKLFKHVQQLRNLSYEKAKTKKEIEREDLKWNHDVVDVENRGYGSAYDLTCLFIALARAAGFQADLVLTSSRFDFFFDAAAMNPRQLNSRAAVVMLDNKALYFQPGVPVMPFGTLPWDQTGVSGLRIEKVGGSWVKTPLTKADEAQTQRRAQLKLDNDSLTGSVVVSYTGLQASNRRYAERHEDATARKEHLINEMKRVIPSGSTVELTNDPDWNNSETPLVVEYKIGVPGWVVTAGKRALLNLGVFGAGDKHLYEHEIRVHPIYYHFANKTVDDISIELPAEFQIASMPKSRDDNISVAQFSSSASTSGNTLHINRMLTINGIYLPQKYYPALREFYQGVRAYDEEQVVLTRTK